MLLKNVKIGNYRNFQKNTIVFEKNKYPPVFSIASQNGGGKSTLLQFIFIMLHCFSDKEKLIYIKNLLQNTKIDASNVNLSEFIIEHKKNEYFLNFSIRQTFSQEHNFNLFLDIKDIENKIKKNRKYSPVIKLRKILSSSKRFTPVIEKQIWRLRELLQSSTEYRMFEEASMSNDIAQYIELVDFVLESNDISTSTLNEIEIMHAEYKEEIGYFTSRLKSEKLFYITHFDSDNLVLILETNMPEEIFPILSKKVFLTTPSSQMFHFLESKEKTAIFNNFSNKDTNHNSYEYFVNKAKELMSGFFTYDFASTDLILKSIEKAFEEDKKIKLKTSKYGTNYDTLEKELSNFLEGKTISVNDDFDRVIFTLKNTKQELLPEELSHGELKKLSIYIWLKYIVENDSIILMDEVDIALHPKWQYKIIKDLIAWAPSSQFLIATHSPQILSSTYFKNIIKLESENSKTNIIRYNHPPLDRNINVIITSIMEAPDFPEDLRKLHITYRKMVVDGKVDSDEAVNLKNEILEHESENSSFFQDINFDLELM